MNIKNIVAIVLFSVLFSSHVKICPGQVVPHKDTPNWSWSSHLFIGGTCLFVGAGIGVAVYHLADRKRRKSDYEKLVAEWGSLDQKKTHDCLDLAQERKALEEQKVQLQREDETRRNEHQQAQTEISQQRTLIDQERGKLKQAIAQLAQERTQLEEDSALFEQVQQKQKETLSAQQKQVEDATNEMTAQYKLYYHDLVDMAHTRYIILTPFMFSGDFSSLYANKALRMPSLQTYLSNLSQFCRPMIKEKGVVLFYMNSSRNLLQRISEAQPVKAYKVEYDGTNITTTAPKETDISLTIQTVIC